MRLNASPSMWKLIVAVILILLTDAYQALTTLGRLPQTLYEATTILIHALILAFTFLSIGEKPDG